MDKKQSEKTIPIVEIWETSLKQKQELLQKLRAEQTEVNNYIRDAQGRLETIKRQMDQLYGAIDMGKSLVAEYRKQSDGAPDAE